MDASDQVLKDAAFNLWINKYQLDAREPPSPFKTQRQALNRLMTRILGAKWSVRRAMKRVKSGAERADSGPTFRRLKAQFPFVSETRLKDAIRAAVQLDQDCVKNFSYSKNPYMHDVARAVALARASNPGFSEETYRRAETRVAIQMR
jgi:hypothetical protein